MHRQPFSRRVHLPFVVLFIAIIATLLLAFAGVTIIASPHAISNSQSSPATTQAKVARVSIVEQNGMYEFQPALLKVSKGTQVVWTNNSDTAHTVSSNTNVFGTTSDLGSQQRFSSVFTKAGTFAYHCNIHTYMHGTIVVTP